MTVATAAVRASFRVATGDADLEVDELRGSAGPTVVLLGGVHGDEPEGVLAARRVAGLLGGVALAGAVRVLAVAHPPAHAAAARCSPADGGDLARAFPGDRSGPPTARVAAAISEAVLGDADLLIDLHSAGRVGAMPLFCGFLAGGDPVVAARSQAAARAFAAPLTWAHDAIGPGRSLTAAAQRGIPAIYVEAGGGGEVRGVELDAMVRGTLAVLAAWGLLDAETAAALAAIATPSAPLAGATDARLVVRGGSGDLDRSRVAAAAGTLVTRVRVGERVASGATLADLVDDRGRWLEAVTTAHDGIVMFLRREARVAAGDAVALVAPVPEAW
jgi:predicted deacylase